MDRRRYSGAFETSRILQHGTEMAAKRQIVRLRLTSESFSTRFDVSLEPIAHFGHAGHRERYHVRVREHGRVYPGWCTGPFGPSMTGSIMIHLICAVAPCLAPVSRANLMLTQLEAKATWPCTTNPEVHDPEIHETEILRSMRLRS